MNREGPDHDEATLGDALLRLVANSDAFEEALSGTLRLVGETADWSYGEAWLPESDGGVLRLEATWHADPDFASFAEASAERTFGRGVGLPGRVWRDGTPEQVPDLASVSCETFERVDAASAAVLNAAVGIPVVTGDDAVAVLLFLTEEPRSDDAFVANVSDAVRQLGHLFVSARVREELERERNSFEDVIENSPVPILVFDADGTITRVNQRFETLFDLRRDDIVGEHLSTDALRLYDSNGDRLDPRSGPSSVALREGRSVHDVPLDIEIVGGVRRSVVANATPIFGEDSEPARVVTAYVDVTEQRAREAELEAKNAELEAFASIVAHDLRNPLSVADGFTGLAKETGDLSHLDRVERAHERMATLISDLLLLARKGRAIGEKSTVDVTTVARMAWNGLDTDSATCIVDPETGSVLADSGRLTQLFENLFRNSVEHGGEGVSVRVGPLPDAPGFYVEDDGPGVPEERRDALVRRSDEGGLGLKIVAAIAEGHGWELRADEATQDPDAPGLRLEFHVGDAGDDAADDTHTGSADAARFE